jgi:enamine deaminase RidA (YjgF/YER057c/UK114 family)
MTRQFVPFGQMWSLRVPVPYSGLVRDGDRAWSSGQLALDVSGDVRAPGDIAAQAVIIADNIAGLLAEAGLGADDVSRMVLYSAAHDPADQAGVVDYFLRRFGDDSLVEVVPVPHFYYDGVLLEVDVFCAPSDPVIEEDLPGGGRARVKREGEMVLVNLTAPPTSLGRAIGGLLTRHALSPDQLLSGWGIAPEPLLSAVPGQVAPRLPGFFAGALMPCYMIDDKVHLYLTFGIGDVEIAEQRGGRVRLHLARAGTLAVLDGRYLGGRAVGLEAQTEAVMDELAMMLEEHGMDFTDVVKATTFYAGGNTAEELHGNLAVRNRFYSAPGPASTGVPIARMADPGAKVRIELVLRPPQR